MSFNGNQINFSLNQKLYLDLMKGCLTRSLFKQRYEFVPHKKGILGLIQKFLGSRSVHLVRPLNSRPEWGMGWPVDGETMIGTARLNHLQGCIEEILNQNIPGDLMETGVWRGGATIFMRAVLKAHQDTSRTVWVADSFQGLPPPNAKEYPVDKKMNLFLQPALAISMEEVEENFKKYGLLDEQVKFLPGWFRDSLPKAKIERLALLRLDGDMYESTMDGLRYLYPRLSPGGYLIIDDYGALNSCKNAVEDFRKQNGVTEEIKLVDASCAFWKKINP